MGQISQFNRVAELRTPLGKDVLALISFSATEGLSELFEIHVEALSETPNIDFDQVLGQVCTLDLKAYKGKQRLFNGILAEAKWVEMTESFFHYRLEIRPWLWLLGHQADCRIFLDKDVKTIIREVFTRAGFSDFDFRTTADYDIIPYCVQYRETDLAFVSRLMEEYGIYYFFEHSDGQHVMVLADSRASHSTNLQVATLSYLGLSDSELHTDQFLGNWVSERRVRTGKVVFNDYDYLKPNKMLRASNTAHEKYTHSNLEVYDYPGKYDDQGKGTKFSKFRLEAEQSFDHRRHVDGDAASLFPGSLFTVQQHPFASENQEFLVVRCNHSFSTNHYRSGPGPDEQKVYHGHYELLPSDRQFRTLPATPKPRIQGVQTAKVVAKKGEDGEEISTDENGHIWVQFHWDREPQKSCPIRVAQCWSGSKWGEQHIPRIGMEVVVEFLEGDPDRPLVVGCVYNGNNRYPYDLPGNKTQSGLKSDSTKGHNGYNEFMFEDKKGHELIRLHAQRDHQVIVLGSQDGSVGGDQTWTVGDNRSWTIKKGNDTINVEAGSQNVTIAQDQNVSAGNSITLSVGNSIIYIDENNINIHSTNIRLTADNAINLYGAAGVNAATVLNAPAASFGAATVAGTPV